MKNVSSGCANCSKCNTKALNESIASMYNWDVPGGDIDCPECCPASGTNTESRYTSNINLKKPRPTERFCLSDWNGNMDIVDSYIGSLMKQITCLSARIDTLTEKMNDLSNKSTFTNLPDDIITTGLLTVEFCKSLINSDSIKDNILYVSDCNFYDGPVSESAKLTVRVINGNDVYLFINSGVNYPYLWFFHYYKDDETQVISDEWLPVSAKATSSTFGMIKLTEEEIP